MEGKRVLVVMPEVPFPPRKNGVTLRYYPLLLRLSKKFRLTLAAVTDHDDIELGDLRACLDDFIPLQRANSQPSLITKILAQRLRFFPLGVPYDYFKYTTNNISKQIGKVLVREYDAIVWVTLDHLLFENLHHLKKHRLIIDAIDSISLHAIRSTPTNGLIDRLKIGKMKRWEAAIMSAARVGFYISPVDLDAIAPLVQHTKLHISPNGILIEDYIAQKASLQSPSLGFLGNMSYGPNIEAAHRLYRLYRALKKQIPDLSLYIIGRDPDESLLRYTDDPNVHVTGTIDNIWPYVNAVDIFVMPMVKGAGQQNKLLEVMYARRPIVASSVANGGVLAVDNESILIADDELSLQQKILSLLKDVERREKIAAAGERFVRETYDWDAIAARFAAAIEGTPNC